MKRALLSIAGYDPSSGAGVLLDVAVFRRFGFVGTAILTSLTAQNSRRVRGVRCLDGRWLLSQYAALKEDIPPSGIKVGMLGCRENIPALESILNQHRDIPVVVDPVLRSSSGRWLLERGAVPAFLKAIRGRISVLTPNLHEASLISGRRLENAEAMKEAARRIVDRTAAPCLVKGGHLASRIADILYDGAEFFVFTHDRVPGEFHGTGCFLSASILGYLALGKPLPEACGLAAEITVSALRDAVRFGKGRNIFFLSRDALSGAALPPQPDPASR
jgi:hydroxymethylpyrimidine/phosphomethylpyrimidine kinase